MTAEVERGPTTSPPAQVLPARDHRTKQRRPVRAVLSQVALTVVLIVFLMPFVWMIATALKPQNEVFSTPPSLIGSQVLWSNFSEAWNYLPFGRFILNTLLVSAVGTVVVCVTSILAGYAFARLSFIGRDKIFLVYLGALMVPQDVIVVPMFILMQKLGWVDSYAGLILPWAFTAFGTFLLRQFFLSVPRELEEAAVIDGASKLRTLLQVILPIARPAVAVLAVFTFIGYWNSFLWPLIVVNSRDMSTIPLGLNLFLSQNGDRWDLLMAASTISILPTVILVVLLQRHLVRGIAISGFGGR